MIITTHFQAENLRFEELSEGDLFSWSNDPMPTHKHIGLYVKISATKYRDVNGYGGLQQITAKSVTVVQLRYMNAFVNTDESKISEAFLTELIEASYNLKD